jgi:hypothetical protein
MTVRTIIDVQANGPMGIRAPLQVVDYQCGLLSASHK